MRGLSKKTKSLTHTQREVNAKHKQTNTNTHNTTQHTTTQHTHTHTHTQHKLTQLGNATGQHSGGVQVGKSGGGGGIRQVIGRHVDGLHGRDRALLGGGDALLHAAHVRGQRRLVTDGRGDTTQQGRHLFVDGGERVRKPRRMRCEQRQSGRFHALLRQNGNR